MFIVIIFGASKVALVKEIAIIDANSLLKVIQFTLGLLEANKLWSSNCLKSTLYNIKINSVKKEDDFDEDVESKHNNSYSETQLMKLNLR